MARLMAKVTTELTRRDMSSSNGRVLSIDTSSRTVGIESGNWGVMSGI